MSIKQALNKIVAPKLAEYGFNFEGNHGKDSYVYSSKLEDGTKQYIVFKVAMFDVPGLRVEFSTSHGILDTKLGHLFLKEKRDQWWKYKNSQELEYCLNEVLNICTQYGMKWMELKSVPEIQIPENNQRQLLNNPGNIGKQFGIKHGLDMNAPASITEVETILRTNKFDNQIDWDLLIDSSAYFGELVIRSLGGNWGWNSYYNVAAILNVGGTPEIINVLNCIAKYYNQPLLEENGVRYRYNMLCNGINSFKSLG